MHANAASSRRNCSLSIMYCRFHLHATPLVNKSVACSHEGSGSCSYNHMIACMERSELVPVLRWHVGLT